jgi:hypothetical protein
MSAPLDIEGPAAPPRSSGELVFAEPWESRAFGMAVTLYEAGTFTWPQFQTALIARIAVWEAGAARASLTTITGSGWPPWRTCSPACAPCPRTRSPHAPKPWHDDPEATTTATTPTTRTTRTDRQRSPAFCPADSSAPALAQRMIGQHRSRTCAGDARVGNARKHTSVSTRHLRRSASTARLPPTQRGSER